MKNNIKSEINKIEIPEQLDSHIKSGVELATPITKKKTHRKLILPSFFYVRNKRKVLYVLGVGIIVILLLFNTLIQSRTMLVYASEIPVISSIFNLKPLSVQIIDELEEKDYYTDNVGIDISVFSGKEIIISLGGASIYQKNIMDDIRVTVEKFLQNNQYGSFKVNMEQRDAQVSYNLSNVQQTEKKNMEEEIKELVSELNIETEHIYVEPLDKYISINISTSINNEEELREHAQFVKKELIDNTDFTEYEFYVTASTPELSVGNDGSTSKPLTDLDRKIGHLARMLTENDIYKVIGFSFTEEPLTFKIRTSVSASDKEHGSYIQKVIEDYFNSTDVQPSVKSDSYQIYVYSKDEKQIN